MRMLLLFILTFSFLNGATAEAKELNIPARIRTISKEIRKIRERQQKEAYYAKWYREQEAVLAQQREKPWQIFPSLQEWRHRQTARGFDELITQENQTVEIYKNSIYLYALAHVITYDKEARKNLLVAKNLVPYIEEGRRALQSLEDSRSAIDSAQAAETMSFVSNAIVRRSGTVYSAMGTKASRDAFAKTQESFKLASAFYEKLHQGAQQGRQSVEPLNKSPAYNPAAKAYNSVLTLKSLAEIDEHITTVSTHIDLVVTTLVESVHMLEKKNDRIAIDFANSILSE
ncbi:hypothetical protein QJS83_08715 [Bdellovibrio sp. 22V]|uniref:hypothetical protein n=1 Tax=Bdellovibrio sp. 22V TaxID=3044166 RepID=UPI002542EB09|nr:hypothetical protein [Bdellovibrio sp. 22V]WII70538.1 hypothetical protein QJS83_08715 [Bdellovibrio sp. 22V]